MTRMTPTTPPIVLSRSLPIVLPQLSSTGCNSKHTTINLNKPLMMGKLGCLFQCFGSKKSNAAAADGDRHRTAERGAPAALANGGSAGAR